MQNYKLETYKFKNQKLELYTTPHLFAPNTITTRFTRAIEGLDRATVFDIGTGVAPLAIWASLEGASEVYAIDAVREHIEVARLNISKYGLEGKVHAYEGNIFSTPEGALEGKKADIIIGDVSGIADKAARALGLYPQDVPTGGDDGTDVIIGLLENAPKYLTENGVLYFAIAIGLSDDSKIMNATNKHFNSIEPLRDTPQLFPLTDAEVKVINESYDHSHPDFIKIIEQRGRFGWQGQMYKVSNPK